MKTWKIDSAHSAISFSLRHLLVARVRGSFRSFGGAVSFDPFDATPGGTATVHIDAASIDTNEPTRDAHLRSADFLNVAVFPHIVFRSTSATKKSDRELEIMGELTIRGVTREVVLTAQYGGTVRDPSGEERIGFSAHATINRKAFGVTFNQVLDTGGVALGDKIEVQIEVEAVAQEVSARAAMAATAV